MLAVDGLVDSLRLPGRQLQSATARCPPARESLAALREIAGGVFSLGRVLQPDAPLSIEGAIGPHRRWAVGRARAWTS